jgi:hypothetical protein
MPRDFNGALLAELEDKIRFREARPRDHLCIPFQCSNCQSQNIRGRSIDTTLIDDLVFECMVVQATLDAFWPRASKTVGNHVQEVRNMACYGGMFQYPPMPVLGSWPLYTHLGIDAAVMVLMQSMEKGRGGGMVKYGTARKACATLTVLWESSPSGGNDMTLSAGLVKGQFVATRCPSEGRWYQHFETRICARMGDVVTQNRAYTIEVLLALIEMYEEEWQTYYVQMPLVSVCACMFLLVSCLGGMQGFEVVWTDLAALRYDIAHCESAKDDSAVSWPIMGRFKGQHGILDCYMIPIAGVTNSGIQFFTWTQRFLRRLGREGVEDGWAFRRPDGSRAKASDSQDNIF